jgi:hypothetical protein
MHRNNGTRTHPSMPDGPRRHQMGAISALASPHSPTVPHQLDYTSGSGPQCAHMMNQSKEWDEVGNVKMRMSDSDSDSKSSNHDAHHEPSTIQLGKPFISISDETMKGVEKMTAQLHDYRGECCDMQAKHKREFKLSLHKIKHYKDLTAILDSRTKELLKNYKLTTSMMHRHFDLMDLQKQHAVDSVHALKDILLCIHHDSFSLDDYYLVINELLRGALTLLASQFNRLDTCLIAFKSDMEGMFHCGR